MPFVRFLQGYTDNLPPSMTKDILPVGRTNIESVMVTINQIIRAERSFLKSPLLKLQDAWVTLSRHQHVISIWFGCLVEGDVVVGSFCVAVILVLRVS